MAQAAILALWALEWRRVGVTPDPAVDPRSFAVVLGTLILAAPPAVLVGLADAVYSRGDGEGSVRRVALSALVVAFAVYATACGIASLNLMHVRDPPPMIARLGALVGIESAFLLELGLAARLRRRREDG